MRRTWAIALGIVLAAPSAFAGPNEGATLAMHTVASDEYLYCPELTTPGTYFPATCREIDNSATLAELGASYGYVYVVLCAYNVTDIRGVEFCISGWPRSLHGPDLFVCPWCSFFTGYADSSGGVAGFGESLIAENPSAPVGFAWFAWNALSHPEYLPTTLEYTMSSYSDTCNPHNQVLGPHPQYPKDLVAAANMHGCTVGGTHWETVPYGDCVTALDHEMGDPAPTTFALLQTGPNPFGTSTVIQYALPVGCHVNLTVYDLVGRKVKTVLDQQQPPGYREAYWDGKNEAGIEVSPGVYFCRLQAGSHAETRKMVLLE